MDKQRRKELLAQYKEIKRDMGVVQVTNTQNGKIYITSYPDLNNQWETIQGWLNSGTFGSGALTADWKAYGPDAFTYEVLEQKENSGDNARLELRRMEKAWLDKKQPYDENGYNVRPKF